MSDRIDTSCLEVKAVHSSWYTLRIFGKRFVHCDGQTEQIMARTLAKFETSEPFKTLPKPCHVVINCLPAQTINAGDGEGIGLYLEGIQVVSIGMLYPGRNVVSRAEWVREVELSILHELAHWVQDMTGQLGADGYEDQAESMAVTINAGAMT